MDVMTQVQAMKEETLAARLHYLRDEISDTQAAFKEMEGGDAEMAFRIYNADWGAFKEGDWYGRLEKDRVARMSMGPNWIVPVVDQILVSLLGKGVGMAVVPQHPAQIRYTSGLTQILGGVLDQCEWRTLLSTSLIHIALGRRAVFKTGMRCGVEAGKRPDVELIRPNRFWFDLEALTPKRCSFMVELRLYSLAEFHRRFSGAALDISCEEFCAITPNAVPMEYSSHGWFGEQAARQREKRVLVYEHYDFYRREITFLLADAQGEAKKILCRTPLVRCPYVIATFSPNGMDARGQSEAVNILRQQRNLDYLSDRVTVAMNASKSGLVVDGRFINKVEVAKLADQPDVTIFRMEVREATEQMPGDIRQYIMPAPQFNVPDALWAMQEKIEKDIALSTAFAEIQQGRAAGFRSATEASIADSNLRGRIAHKSGSWHDALIAVAQEMLWLMGTFHEAEFIPIHVANSGEAKWDVMRIPTCLMRLPLACKVDAYNPVSQNPLVIAETLQGLMPLLQQLPDVNWRNLVETLLVLMGLPLDLLKPPGQVKAEAAAKEKQAAAAATQSAGRPPQLDLAGLAAAMGGGGGGAPPIPSPTDIPMGAPGAVPGMSAPAPAAPSPPPSTPPPPLPSA